MHLLEQGRLPESLNTEEELDELLTRPTQKLVDFVRTLQGPLLLLGAGGKMGPTLALLAKRAAEASGHTLRVIAASRFSNSAARTNLEREGVATVACDLLDASAVAKLPEAPTIIYLVGLKFGTTADPAATWAINTVVPSRVMERFPNAKIVALSTANVYPQKEVADGGSIESDPLTPIGEYANSAVGRDRIFQYYSARFHTPMALLRLSYAVELRYGVLVDIAQKVAHDEAIDLANGYITCIWQGDANDAILRAFALADSSLTVWNLCRPEIYSVRTIAQRFGELLGRVPRFSGQEAPTAMLANAHALCAKLGTPSVSIQKVIQWAARWVARGGANFGRPTHFEVRDGGY